MNNRYDADEFQTTSNIDKECSMSFDTDIVERSPTSREEGLAWITYALYGASLFTFLPIVPAVILNYVQSGSVKDTFLASHYTWLKWTFWCGFIGTLVGLVLLVVLVGFVVLPIVWIWIVYRLIKGAVRLSEGKSV